MRILAWLGLAAALALPAGSALAQSEIVKLDYLRYEGRYYEIARLPTYRERNCATDTVMTFLRRTDLDVSIVYQCFEEDKTTWLMDIGRLHAATERAPGELSIGPDLIGWNPWQWGTYRLIEAAEDLSYALVGNDALSQLWVLSRTRQMNEATYKRLLARASERGYDTSKLVRSVQTGL